MNIYVIQGVRCGVVNTMAARYPYLPTDSKSQRSRKVRKFHRAMNLLRRREDNRKIAEIEKKAADERRTLK